MGKDRVSGLRARMAAPAEARTTAQSAVPAGEAARIRRAERVLRIAADLFAVRTAALVAADGEDLRVEIAWSRADWREADVIGAARDLHEALNATGSAVQAGVLEDIALYRGFRAATPVISVEGRALGAICLVDPERRTLLSGLQRRLLAEFGGLLQQTLDTAGAVATKPAPRAADTRAA